MTNSTMTTEAIKATTIPENAVVVNNYTWNTCEYGQYRIEKTRFGLFKSIGKDGEDLVTGATEDAVLAITPIHLEANSPNYDGRFDGNKFSSFVSGKL
jgi:hypothetical protein